MVQANVELRAMIAAAITKAAIEANRISGGEGAWDSAPESWLQCAIVPSVSEYYYVLLEAPTSKLLKWHEAQQESLERGGRIDIALFGRTPDPAEASLVALIEVKKYGQKLDCVGDAARLRALARHIATVQTALLVAHVEGRTEQELEDKLNWFLEDAQVPRDQMLVERFQVEGVFCASAIANLR